MFLVVQYCNGEVVCSIVTVKLVREESCNGKVRSSKVTSRKVQSSKVM